MTADDDRTLLGDPDGTILMPRPGGARGRDGRARADRPGLSPITGPRPSGPGLEWQRRVAGLNPLLGTANPLLSLVPRLRAASHHDDPAALRKQLLEQIGRFEEQSRAAGIPKPKVSAARYLLCSFIDDIIAATPWGAGGWWAEHNLLQAFHEERWGGDKAFELLDRLSDDLPGNADVLELFYVCFTLGYEGRFRNKPNGRAQVDAIATRLLDLLRPPATRMPARGARELSVHWEGTVPPRRNRLAVLPLWVVPVIGAAIVLAALLMLNRRLDALAAPAFHELHDAATALRVERPAAAAAMAPARLAPKLAADVASGMLSVRDDALQSTVTVPADALFADGTAQLSSRALPLVRRIGEALAGQPGQIVVTGHTDDRPPSSLQYPSNWQFSRARAQAVADALAPSLAAQAGETGDRLRAEGRADTEPLGAETDAASRVRNRRIEIAVLLPRPER